MSETTIVGPTYGNVIVEALTRHSGRDALVSGDRRVTYGEAADTVSRIQQVLSNLGLSQGHGVAILSPNLPEVFLVQAATILSGARYTGLHPLGSVDDHVFICADADIDILIVHPSYLDVGATVTERSPSVRHLLTLGPADTELDLVALCEELTAKPLDASPAEGDLPAWVAYTGGTTGRPKGVTMSQRALVQGASLLAASWDLPETPRYLVASPITHAAVLPIVPTLSRGGTVILQQGFDPHRWSHAIEAERANFSFIVPTMLSAVLDHTDLARVDTSSLETLIYGAGPSSASRIEEAYGAFGPVLLQAYGQTECMGMATTLRKDEHDPVNRPELLTSCGRPVSGVRVELLDEDGHITGDGQVGEICVRSRAVMDGYRNRPEETAAALRDGWLRTGDLATRDDAGFFRLVDRAKDMIVTGGFNVYSKEVEDVLNSDPSVAAAAVVGIPDEKWGERVVAYVVPRSGAAVDTTSLSALVKEKKGSHQAPKSIAVVDALPLTLAGKIDKKLLRANHAGPT